MAYYSQPPNSQPTPPSYYSATPPAPPPKAERPVGHNNEPLELDGGQTYHYQQHYQRSPPPPPPLPQHERPQQQEYVNVRAIEPGWLPESLTEKNTSDLHELLQNPNLQSAFLSSESTTHPSIPASLAPLQNLLQANTALATSLSETEARLRAKREATQSRLLALRALEQQHRAKVGEAENALDQFRPRALYQRLSGAVQEQGHVLRGVEESWLDSSSDVADGAEVEAFVRRVKEARRLEFLRLERKRRWDEVRVGGWR